MGISNFAADFVGFVTAPVRTAARAVSNSVQTGVNAASKLLDGDLGGAVGALAEGGKRQLSNALSYVPEQLGHMGGMIRDLTGDPVREAYPELAPDGQPQTTAAPRAAEGGYQVQRGDTLWDIARRHGTSYQEIARLNGLEDPDKIYPGQVFRLPERRERESVLV